jgi:hypothetical protein
VAVAAHANPGVFTPAAFPPVADEATVVDVALADLDSDGDRDVYLVFGALQGPGGVEVALVDRVFLNDGSGGFADAGWTLDAASPQAGVGVAIEDLDLDGLPDAVVAGGAVNDGTTLVAVPTQVYRNDGTSLVLAQSLGPVHASTAIAAADWDVDGDPDIAIARFHTHVDLYRNDGPGAGPGSPIVFTEVQRLEPSDPGTRLRGLRFAEFGGDAFADLVVGHQQPGTILGGPTGPAGVVVFRNENVGGNRRFVLRERADLPNRFIHDIAAGDLGGVQTADVVVAATWLGIVPPPVGASAVINHTTTGLVLADTRFPLQGQVAVEIGDLGIDGVRDLVFGVSRCIYGPCPSAEVASIGIWNDQGGTFVHNGQCYGRHSPAAQALALGDLDNDDLPDIFVTGARESGATLSADGVGWLSNNGAPASGLCCVAQVAAAYRDDGPTAAKARRARLKSVAAVDLDAYARVRDELMGDATNGDRLRSRYALFSPEVATMMLADPTLWLDAANVLTAWSGPLRALVDGDGASASVSQSMIDALDAFLARLSTSGSAGLAQTIAEERALLPPFAAFVGLNMNQFRAIALPQDAVFGDGFETVAAP